MATGKSEKKQKNARDVQGESLWRKPITLDSFEDDDPLATLYRGGEASSVKKITEENVLPNIEDNPENKDINKIAGAAVNSESTKKTVLEEKQQESQKKSTPLEKNELVEVKKEESQKTSETTKITESELKNILKIKSDSFHFTDIREILRGKSFDIYAYLRFLSGDAGVCKIKHLDLMKILDISRPTLFKQGEWLIRLSLIEKRNVPGDHLGTSYRIHRLEDVLPISESLVKQLESHIENLKETID